ncbi:snRNA-activating protein complex subunit 3 isoform X3 [Engystomops pustulosus]|uniref:snRNA-activating protein complex subunit 3 isoform X3 n=1 Tax=Engystomops pustulosus TaxID=76066 RepID=UPI003AFACA94
MAGRTDENIPTYEVANVNTKKIHVGSFGHLWRQNLSSCELSLAEGSGVDLEDEELATELDCTADIATEIKSLCSVDALKSNEDGEEADPEIIPEDSCLVTLSIRNKIIERRKEMAVDRAFRQEVFLHEMESCGLGARPEDLSDLVDEGELVLTLEVFHPVVYQKSNGNKPNVAIQVLGTQKLTELRDAIKCVSDLQIGGEFSSNPDLAPENICKDLFKSAFFYFEGVFYNDMRYPECRDLSRLIHHEDCLDRRLYPLYVRKHWFCTRKCNVCNIYVAKWVTNQDSLAPDDPCFFCDVCFKMLHYDTEGNKLGDFLAYVYVDHGTFN